MLNKKSGFKGLCGTNEFGKITQLAQEQLEKGEEGKELLCVRIFENRILVSHSRLFEAFLRSALRAPLCGHGVSASKYVQGK